VSLPCVTIPLSRTKLAFLREWTTFCPALKDERVATHLLADSRRSAAAGSRLTANRLFQVFKERGANAPRHLSTVSGTISAKKAEGLEAGTGGWGLGSGTRGRGTGNCESEKVSRKGAEGAKEDIGRERAQEIVTCSDLLCIFVAIVLELGKRMGLGSARMKHRLLLNR
jgi:hypothetical protein